MAAQQIRETVDMQTVLDLYGYHADRNGFMCCPFHGERAGSLKVYTNGRGWHCYGCGRGGSVIDFVMEHESCEFRTAVIAIDKALHLGLMDPKEDLLEASEQKKIQMALDEFAQAVYDCLDVIEKKIEHELNVSWKKMKKCFDDPDKVVSADEWNWFLNWEDDDNYNHYRLEKVRELRKEVAEWRRKYRRVIM